MARPKIYAKDYFPEARVRAGFTQRRLAAEIGISGQWINDIENKRGSVSAALAKQLAQILNAQFDDIFEVRLGGNSRRSRAYSVNTSSG